MDLSLPLVPILSQINSVHTLAPYFFKIILTSNTEYHTSDKLILKKGSLYVYRMIADISKQIYRE
jgi:hypothetical protein